MAYRSTGCGGRQGLRWVGDPVDVVTGTLADAAAEFTLPLGRLGGEWGDDTRGFVWRRYYSTASRATGPLGWGHTHEHDRTLRAVVDGWLYTHPDGETILFPFASDGAGVEREGFVLRPLAGGFAVEAPTGATIDFAVPHVEAVGRPRRMSFGTWSIALEHDARGRLIRAADDADARVMTFDYDGGRITAIWLARHPSRPEGRPLALMRYRYDADGQLLAATDRYGHAQTFAYDEARRMVTRVDRNGYRFEYQYDAQGRCVVSRGHDGGGRCGSAICPRRRRRRSDGPTGGSGCIATTRRCRSRRSSTRTEGRGGSNTTRQGGSSARRTPPETRAGRCTAWLDRSRDGRRLRAGCGRRDSPSGPLPHRVPRTPCELELGDLSQEVLDGAPLASAGIAPVFAGGASIFSALFDERDERAEASCRRDKLGLLVEERGPEGAPRRWAYTPNGWVRWYADHDGGRYEFEFAGGNMRVAAKDPLGRTIRYEYTATNQIAAVVDPAGNRHLYRYDLRDALTEVHHCEKLVETYSHDQAGNLVAKHDAQGQMLVAYEYGRDGLKSRRRLADGEEHRYEYTPAGQFARIEWSDHALEFAYTPRGRRRRDWRDGRGVEHRYVGSRLAETTVLGRFTTRYRRLDVRTLEVVDPLGNSHRLVLEPGGTVIRHLACGAREVAQYDSEGRCLGKHLFPVHGDAVWRRVFGYSAEGDLLAVRDSERGETRYQYDAAHQLAAVSGPDGASDVYRYDAAANLVEAPHLRAATVGSGNLLLAANRGHMSYDHRNNVATWQRDGKSLRFHRDALDRLRRIEGLDAPWTAEYDPLGRRLRKTFGADWTEYFWDTDRLAAEVRADGRVRVYVYVDEFALTPWLMIDYDSMDAERGTLHYLVTDQRGAPVAALDAEGGRAWSARLAPYGLAEVVGTLDVSLRLAGQFCDPETGLHYNRFRYYSPELGRYLEEDPAGTGGGLNLYAYTCCPLVQFDPRGLETVCSICKTEHQEEDCPKCRKPTPSEPSDNLAADGKGRFPQDPNGLFPNGYEGLQKTVKDDGKVVYEFSAEGKTYRIEFHPEHDGPDHYPGDHYHVKKLSDHPPPGKTKPKFSASRTQIQTHLRPRTGQPSFLVIVCPLSRALPGINPCRTRQ
ncbi:DUF6531 domain-containing protein [Nannocystis pusilla]|uniref:DUF6531 domain-containing protein n=1 Tax=Nannocystis pusilla TaxID=889268 RepID=A0A9X3J3B7_9BACT|nr:RHS repeat-associated core domain-containing protein [Nannocystis pusilla]MCY1013060.1 DUF6531 domain-containing protein [Nannocystis pusilla]